MDKEMRVINIEYMPEGRTNNLLKKVIETLEEHVTTTSEVVLNYGCGNGTGTLIAALESKGRLVGYDSDKYNIELAKNNEEELRDKQLFQTNQHNVLFSDSLDEIKKIKYDMIINNNYDKEGNEIFYENLYMLKPEGLLMVIDKKSNSSIEDCVKDSQKHFETIEYNLQLDDFYIWIGKKK